MKSLFIFLFVLSTIYNSTAQKMIYLQNLSDISAKQNKSKSTKVDEELTKGIWQNNGNFLKRLGLEIKKYGEINEFEEGLSLYYKLRMNDKNAVESVEYYFGKYLVKTEGKNTSFQLVNTNVSLPTRLKIEKILITSISRNKFAFYPLRAYEISGGLRMEQQLSKNRGSEGRLKNLLATKNDSIKKLNLSGLGINKLPKNIYNYRNLEELDLSKNEFKTFKLNPRKFPKLKRIILAENLLSAKTVKIRRNSSLEMLSLSDNDFSAFPKRIEKSTALKDIHLANNYISITDKVKFQKLRSLELLNFYNNQIGKLSESIGYLENLQVLDLYHNDLKFLPKSISKLQNLQTLAVSNNQLWEFPESFASLANLKTLYAHHNKLSNIQYIPAHLLHLDLGFNLLEEIPLTLQKAQQLEHLDLSNNKIKSGAETLEKLPKLKNVFLALNDFESDATSYARFQKVKANLERQSVVVK
jgi:Leucine-rich repeat (LRR) protein